MSEAKVSALELLQRLVHTMSDRKEAGRYPPGLDVVEDGGGSLQTWLQKGCQLREDNVPKTRHSSCLEVVPSDRGFEYGQI